MPVTVPASHSARKPGLASRLYFLGSSLPSRRLDYIFANVARGLTWSGGLPECFLAPDAFLGKTGKWFKITARDFLSESYVIPVLTCFYDEVSARILYSAPKARKGFC